MGTLGAERSLSSTARGGLDIGRPSAPQSQQPDLHGRTPRTQCCQPRARIPFFCARSAVVAPVSKPVGPEHSGLIRSSPSGGSSGSTSSGMPTAPFQWPSVSASAPGLLTSSVRYMACVPPLRTAFRSTPVRFTFTPASGGPWGAPHVSGTGTAQGFWVRGFSLALETCPAHGLGTMTGAAGLPAGLGLRYAISHTLCLSQAQAALT